MATRNFQDEMAEAMHGSAAMLFKEPRRALVDLLSRDAKAED